MRPKFEISEDGIDPIHYVSDYFSHLTSKEISVLVGSIALLQEVDLSLLQSVLNMEQIEVEEKIGRLMQTDLLDGRFTITHFVLDHFNYKILKQSPNLTIDDRTFLAYLKARFEVTITELENAFDLSYASTIFLLSGFIAKGLLTPQLIGDNKYQFIVHFRYPKRDTEDITNLEKQIVGYFQLSNASTIKEVAETLEEPQHKVLSTLTTLILSDMVLAKFQTTSSLFGGFQLSIEIDRFQVFFPRLSIQILSNEERTFIGYLSLRTSAKIDELVSILNRSQTEVIKLASLLHASNQFVMKLDGDTIRVEEFRPLSVNRSLDVLSDIHGFNYRIMVGLIQTQKRISVREIAQKMELGQSEIIQALISCYIEGLIEGSLDHRGVFTLKALRLQEKAKDITLENWEKIILGALISENVITWPKIAALLEIDRQTARNRAFEFISKGISNTIAKDTVLSLEKVPQLPPLIQISKLTRKERQILGFVQTTENLSIKNVTSTFNISNIQAFRVLYLLTGSGLFQLKRNGKRFHVANVSTIEPELSVSELPVVLQQIIRSIEQINSVHIDLKDIAKTVEISTKDVIFYLYELVAAGYYRGKIEGRKFTKTSSLSDAHDSGVCLYCAKELPPNSDNCPHCGQNIPRCGVCRGGINSNDQLLACPKCKNLSHSNHIRAWLQVKDRCPFCRAKISSNDLLIQQPLL